MTLADLSDILVRVLRCPPERAALHAPYMLQALQLADITTPRRLAYWIGQVGHESGRLRYVREIWGPTAQQARYEPTTPLSKALGNLRTGDGERYLGRGLIQVTGRANYRSLSKRLRASLGEAVPDFEVAPALLQGSEWASMSAADYWRSRNLNRWADADDLLTLTKRINGGVNGIADRQAITAQALSILGA